MEIKKIAVIGAGVMGHGIARLFLTSGFNVNLVDSNSTGLEKGLQAIKKEIERHLVARGKISEADATAMLGRLQGFNKLEDAVSDSDLVIEAIFEDLDVKKKLFSDLERLCPVHTILASNTSTLSITGIAGATESSEKVIGMHFFNPPDVFRLLEIDPGLETAEDTVTIVTDLAKKMKMVPLRVKDTPAFVINIFVRAFFAEAVTLIQNGIASAETIDIGMRTAFGMGTGPCETMDLTGLELISTIIKNDQKYSHLYLIESMVEAGRIGVKNGKGFYDYLPDGTKKLADLSNVVGS
ncbi:MAG: 3-hydroxyacyl-CoA dehydrogenase family protein [Nitrospina sp.]|nr:3-hydroxyacyl-CoA dehydrogenase family protein [Nitrospina sp.]